MRIAQLVNALAIDQVGGLQRYVEDLSAALAARGHEVTVITKRLAPELPERERLPGGVELRRTRTPPRSATTYALRYPVQAALGARAEVRAGDFDVVHAHFALPGLGCRLAGRPYLYTFHAPAWQEVSEERGGRYAWPSALDGAGAAALRLLERAAVRGASGHLLLSAFMRGQLERLAGPGLATRAQLLPGGVDTVRFAPGAPDAIAADPWAAHDGPLLFCARRLVPRMGVHNLVQAMPAVRERHGDVRLAVAGTGFMEPEITERIAALGLSGAVRLLGRVSDEALRDWYRRADLSVLPSAHLEGFGLSTAEALACGTPVVGTPAGATPELLTQLDPALVSAGTSPAALAASVCAALDRGAEALAALGERGRELCVREWSWATVADRHEALYRDALSRRSPTTARW